MIKITKDYEMIKRMLLEDKELFDRISDDYTDPEKFNPDNQAWLGFFENEKCLGLLSFHEETAVVLNMHINIPEKYRGKRSFEIGNGLIQHLIGNCDKRFIKINVKVPSCFPDVIKFARKCGLKTEGIDRKSYVKNGKTHDRVCMGKVIGDLCQR